MIDRDVFLALWDEGACNAEIRRALRVNQTQVDFAIRAYAKDPSRTVDDPNRQQIVERAEEVRQRWSVWEEKRRRRHQRARVHVVKAPSSLK